MLTYTFSRREKFLIGLFGFILLGIAWYRLVYVNTTNQINTLQAEIDDVQSQIFEAQTKLAKKIEMQRVIEQREAEGAKLTPIPTYDNIEPLMKSLSPMTDMADEFVVTFGEVDTTTSSQYVLRNVDMRFVSEEYEDVEEILKRVDDGDYPNIVDQMSIAPDRQNTVYGVSLHALYFERPTGQLREQMEARAAAEAAAATATE